MSFLQKFSSTRARHVLGSIQQHFFGINQIKIWLLPMSMPWQHNAHLYWFIFIICPNYFTQLCKVKIQACWTPFIAKGWTPTAPSIPSIIFCTWDQSRGLIPVTWYVLSNCIAMYNAFMSFFLQFNYLINSWYFLQCYSFYSTTWLFIQLMYWTKFMWVMIKFSWLNPFWCFYAKFGFLKLTPVFQVNLYIPSRNCLKFDPYKNRFDFVILFFNSL